MEEQVTHLGVITNISDKDIEIEIHSASSCGSCGIKSACGMSETAEKHLSVPRPEGREFSIGQPVKIVMSARQGNMAAFLAYFLPTFIIITLTVVLSSYIKEWMAALIGGGAMAVYYFVLYLFREKLRNKFSYEII